MVAMQNWNIYINFLNKTGDPIYGIVTETLPGLVRDFFPEPVNSVTSPIGVAKMFTTILGEIPPAGPPT